MQLIQSDHKRAQYGFALLEALIALLIVSGSIVAVLGWLMQTMLQQQHMMREAIAQRHALDWMSRVQINASALDIYASDWRSQHVGSSASRNCFQTVCHRTELAQWDIDQWWLTLSQELPQAQARMQLLDPSLSLWRISIAWPQPLANSSDTCPAQHQCLHLDFTPNV